MTYDFQSFIWKNNLTSHCNFNAVVTIVGMTTFVTELSEVENETSTLNTNDASYRSQLCLNKSQFQVPFKKAETNKPIR